MRKHVRLCLTLSEIWTMADPRDLRRIVELARIAERVGIGALLIGEHPVMGPDADKNGRTMNPRDWLMAYNQPPDTPFPAQLPLLGAIAAATSRIQLVAGAVIAPLHPPLLLAKELATVDLLAEGRLAVVPSVSWQREEYEALGVDFAHRGQLLDEHLEIWRRLWTEGSPVTYHGRHHHFSNAYLEPGPYRPGGPAIWTAGKTFSPWMVRRAVAFGKGLFPIVPPSEAQFADLAQAMRQAGRDLEDLELITTIPIPPFSDATGLLDLEETMANVPQIVAQGFTTLILKPSMFIDDDRDFEAFCQNALSLLDQALAGGGELAESR